MTKNLAMCKALGHSSDFPSTSSHPSQKLHFPCRVREYLLYYPFPFERRRNMNRKDRCENRRAENQTDYATIFRWS